MDYKWYLRQYVQNYQSTQQLAICRPTTLRLTDYLEFDTGRNFENLK